jgi:ribonucleoside-diphosphate reductase alpha chain
VIEFEQNGLPVRAQFSRFADGALGEIFLDVGKVGSAAQVAASDAAISASIALQFGCDRETLHHALSKLSNGMCAGPLGAAFDLIGDAP